MDCSVLTVFVDDSPPSRRLLEFLARAGCEGYRVLSYEGHVDEIIALEGGDTLVPLVWNTFSNRVLVGCPLTFEGFLEGLKRLLEP